MDCRVFKIAWKRSIIPFDSVAKFLLVPISMVGIFVVLHLLNKEKGDFVIWVSVALPGVAFLCYFLWNLVTFHHKSHKKWAPRFTFFLILTVLVLLTINIKKPEENLGVKENPIAVERIMAKEDLENVLGDQSTTFFISATNPTWQPTYKLRNNEWALIEIKGPTNGTWITDSRKGEINAEGYTNIAGKDFKFPNARAGSLLMRAGDGVPTPWKNVGNPIWVYSVDVLHPPNEYLFWGCASSSERISFLGKCIPRLRASDQLRNLGWPNERSKCCYYG